MHSSRMSTAHFSRHLYGVVDTSSGSSGRVRGTEKHEINVATFGGHLFYDLFSQGHGPLGTPWISYWTPCRQTPPWVDTPLSIHHPVPLHAGKHIPLPNACWDTHTPCEQNNRQV